MNKNILKRDLDIQKKKLDGLISIGSNLNVEYFHIIMEYMKILKNYDVNTYNHCLRVGIISNELCKNIKLSDSNSGRVVMGALIHDLGKIKVPLYVLNKIGKLSRDDKLIIKRHPVIGFNEIRSVDVMPNITKQILLRHHERTGGEGYPSGEINTCNVVDIVAVSDVFDAVTTDRPYRKGMGVEKAKEIIDADFKGIEVTTQLYDIVKGL